MIRRLLSSRRTWVRRATIFAWTGPAVTATYACLFVWECLKDVAAGLSGFAVEAVEDIAANWTVTLGQIRLDRFVGWSEPAKPMAPTPAAVDPADFPQTPA